MLNSDTIPIENTPFIDQVATVFTRKRGCQARPSPADDEISGLNPVSYNHGLTLIQTVFLRIPMVTPGRQQQRTGRVRFGLLGDVPAAIPFVSSMLPSERAKAAGAAVEADISGLKPGEKLTVEWRGKPVWIVRRTRSNLPSFPSSILTGRSAVVAQARRNAGIRQERVAFTQAGIFVVVGICTHLGCSPSDKFTPGPQPSLPNDWVGGFLVPLPRVDVRYGGSGLQEQARAGQSRSATAMFLSDSKLLIGDDKKA